MSAWYRIKKYLQYRTLAGNEHSIHSPFVFKLYTEVISPKEADNKNKFCVFDELNKIRAQLLTNSETLEVTDLGAGSKKMRHTRKISDITKYSVVNQKYGELLFRLTEYFRPSTILELGTSLGLSALYLSKAAPNAKIITVEGCPNTHEFAKKLIEKNNSVSPLRGDDQVGFAERNNSRRGSTLVNSRFDEYFVNEIANEKFDLVYIDGNHTYEATIKYFHELLKITNENSVLIFDDIYWSEGMTKAWEEIKNHSTVTLSIDLYKIGLIFFRKENKQKEHFCLKY